MNEKLTEMVFILDRSGSMTGLEEDTIGGFNALIEKQKGLDGDAIISTVLFNHRTEILHNRINIKKINPITRNQYNVGGMTALLDAIGGSIRHIKSVYANTLKEERPSKVIFVITTDGMENSSKRYSYHTVKKMIRENQKDHDWEFIFLGANIDAIGEASKFGIRGDRAARYHSDRRGTRKNYEAIHEAISSFRFTKTIKNDWKHSIDKDYKDRK